MATARGRTITLLPKTIGKEKLKWIESHCIASAGPYPNITGMRNLYWGKEALIVKVGAWLRYIYLMTHKDDGRELPI